MNTKVLFVTFLCLFTILIICNVAMVATNVAEEWSPNTFANGPHTNYLTTNGTQPTGDPRDGGWPT